MSAEGLGWITLYPSWYVDEVERMARGWPQFTASRKDLSRGKLSFVGEIAIDMGSRVRIWPALLAYSSETPFRPPTATPLIGLPSSLDWSSAELLATSALRMPKGYRRHQMADRSLCLIEVDASNQTVVASGTAVLQRAEEIFRAVSLGLPFPFPDSQDPELEEHFPRAGDVLLGEEFYSEDIGGGGMFYATPTFDTLNASPNWVEQTGIPRELWIGVHFTLESSSGSKLITDWRNDRSEAVVSAFPFLKNQKYSFESATTAGQTWYSDLLIQGRWFSLKSEPEPFQTVSELLEILEGNDHRNALDTILRDAKVENDALIHLGLSFPGRTGGRDWLFVRLHVCETPPHGLKANDFEEAKRSIVRDARISAIRRHRLSRANLELRNRGHVPVDLSTRRVAVLGVGALGGDVADVLAKAGIGTLVLVDYDTVRSGNVIRHIADLSHVGLSKVDAVRALVIRHNPYVKVVTSNHSATETPGTLEQLLRECDLVVSTIADENVESIVNEAAVRLDRTVIYGRALRAGTVARVFRVRPGVDACKECLGLARLCDSKWIDVPDLVDEVITRECGNPVMPGSAADLRLAADLTARAVLDELGNGVDWNNLLWSLIPLPELSPKLAQPYSTVLERYPPDEDCRVCGRPYTKQIFVSATANAAIRSLTQSKTRTETGGVLLGYRTKDGKAVVVEATDSGPNATETAEQYEHDIDYVNEKIREANYRLGVMGQYLGEWHSHLEAGPQPSARDIRSLSNISVSSSYLTDEPVMIIAGLDPNSLTVQKLHGSCFPAGRRMTEVEVEFVNDEGARALFVRSEPTIQSRNTNQERLYARTRNRISPRKIWQRISESRPIRALRFGRKPPNAAP